MADENLKYRLCEDGAHSMANLTRKMWSDMVGVPMGEPWTKESYAAHLKRIKEAEHKIQAAREQEWAGNYD
jgi:hypothetical protein